MAGCELFAMPSTLETPSIAALEAAYMGKKILITEVGSTREYYGDEAIYVNPMSLESITNGLRKVLQQETSESKIMQRNLLWSHTIKALSSFYTELLEEKMIMNRDPILYIDCTATVRTRIEDRCAEGCI